MISLGQLFQDEVEFVTLLPEDTCLIIQKTGAKEDDERFEIMQDSDWNLDRFVSCVYHPKDGATVFFRLPDVKPKALRRLGVHLTDLDWEFSKDDREFIKAVLNRLKSRLDRYC